MFAVSQASGTATARLQCVMRSGRSQTAIVPGTKVASPPPRACGDEAGGRDAVVTAPTRVVRRSIGSSLRELLRLGVLQAEIVRAVEQLEQLAVLDAVDLVAAAFDLRLAHLVTGGFRSRLRFARRLPRRLGGFGAILESVRERRARREDAE